MSEFEQTVGEIVGHIKRSRDGFGQGWAEFHAAEELYKTAKELRRQMLQEILGQNDLAICPGYHGLQEGSNKPAAEQLGIYPRSQMRLYFFQDPVFEREGEYGTDFFGATWLSLLCPEHFPETDEIYRQAETGTEIKSEVIRDGDRYILHVNGEDITDFVNRGGAHINLNGVTHPGEEIYRHFNLPDLPEKPSLDSLKFGK